MEVWEGGGKERIEEGKVADSAQSKPPNLCLRVAVVMAS